MRPSIIIADRAELARAIEREIQNYGPFCDLNHLDVSNVTQMHYLFSKSAFNGDISQWDVSNVKDMWCMLENSKIPWRYFRMERRACATVSKNVRIEAGWCPR